MKRYDFKAHFDPYYGCDVAEPEDCSDGDWVPASVAQALYDELRYAVSWYRSQMEICENDDNEYCASQWRERMNSAAAALSLADGESE